MATEVIHTIRASGGDYTSLSAWEAAQQRDLVAVDQIAVAEVYNDWASGLSDALTIAGWTSDATRRVVIRPAAGNGTNGPNDHGGVPGAGFIITSTTSFGTTVTFSSVHTRLEGIEARHPTNYGTGFGGTTDSVPWQYELDRCIAYDCKAHGTTGGFKVRRAVYTNCLAENNGYGFAMYANFYGYRAYNCVAANNSLGGFYGTSGTDADGSAPAIRNCVAYGNAANYSLTTIYTAGTSNNAGSDGATTAPPGSSPYASNVVAADFVNVASHNWHLSAASGLIGQGANLTGAFSTDIDGDARPGAGAWDIGFDHYVSGGSTQDLTATGGSTATGAATPRADVALAGIAVAIAGGQAQPAAQISLSAAGFAISSGNAQPAANVTLGAAALAQAAGQAGLSADVLRQATGAALAAGNAQLAAQLDALAQGGAQSAGATLLQITVSLVAAGGAQSGGMAVLEGGAAGDLAASGGAQSGGQAQASFTVTLTAAGFVQSIGAGYLAVQVPLTAFDAAIAGGSANLSASGVLLLIRTPGFVATAQARPFRVAARGRTFRVQR